RHHTDGLRLLFLDGGLAQDVLGSLVVGERDRVFRLRDAHACQHSPGLEGDSKRLVARRDGATGLQNRFDQVDARKSTAEARQFGADALALVANAVTLDALCLGGIEEQSAPTLGIARPCQGRACQGLMLGGRTLAAEADMELGTALCRS